MLGAAIHHDFAFLRAYLHSVCSCCSFQSGGEILEFCFAASHEVNVICKAQIAQRLFSIGNGGVEVVEGLLYDVLQIDVEQYWRDVASLANSNSVMLVSKLNSS